MSGMNAFLKQNKKNEKENVFFAASTKFLDENGEPLKWEIKALSSKKAQQIRNECNNISKNGKSVTVDQAKWQRMMAAECTVYPNLRDAELQDSYGVFEPEDLIMELLDDDAEFQAYCAKCAEVCGYNKSDADLVDEAKN